MKKTLSILCILAMILQLLAVLPAAAAEQEEEENKVPTVTVSTVKAKPGDKGVEVTVSIENNPGLIALMMRVAYSKDLTLTGIEKGDALSGSSMLPPEKPYPNPSYLLWDSMEADAVDGVLVTLTFDVSKKAAGVCAVTVSCDPVNSFDGYGDECMLTVVNGGILTGKAAESGDAPVLTVTAVEAKPGDKGVEVTVSLGNNPGIKNLKLNAVYSSGLTLTGITQGKVLPDTAMKAPKKPYEGPATLSWEAKKADAEDGVLVTLTFDVSKKASGACAVAVSCDPDGGGELMPTVVGGGITIPEPAVTSIRITSSRKTLRVGQEFTLRANVQPEGVKVTWSSDSDAVSVDSVTGRITAKKAGKAVITAAAGGKTAACTVTVNGRS